MSAPESCTTRANVYYPFPSLSPSLPLADGKRYSSIDMLPVCTWHCGIISSDLSGWEKFEGVDPARWCPRGYAIASVDHRGAGNSEGSVQVMGKAMGEDGYDVVEALAKMEWCNGKVGMAGNSYLAISQYFTACEQPPSLKALAPWEGCGDLFVSSRFSLRCSPRRSG